MSTIAGSFSVLSFDSPMKMKKSLVEAFFTKHSKKFGAWHSGVHRCEEPKQVVKDSQNNEIFLFHYALHQRKSMHGEWLSKSTVERANVLLKVATKLEESSELIGQLEYVVRGILPRDTRTCVTQIANYFRYYSNLVNLDCGEDKLPKNHFMFHFTNVASILVLAQIAQCFASGRSVAFLVDKDVAALAILFIELCHEAGVTKELFSIIPTVEAPVEDLPDVLFNKSTSLSWGTTMAVYETSDVDSAVEIVTRAAWDQKGLAVLETPTKAGYHDVFNLAPSSLLININKDDGAKLNTSWYPALLPWALKRILIQESIYESFIAKLSKKIEQFKWELPDEYNLDDSTKKMIANVETVLEKATKRGIKHLPMHSDFTTAGTRTLFKPVVLLDNVPPYFWETLSSGIPTPVITAQSFRTTKEAVSLINNTSSFALSIWGNNITVCNELALTANVSCVWVNAFGLLSADIAVKDNKNLNCSFLGGLEGFDSNLSPDFDDFFKYDSLRIQSKEPQISSEVEKISKLQTAWAKTKKEKKVSCLLGIAKCLENNESHWSSLQTKEGKMTSEDALKIIEKSIKYIKFAALFCEQLEDTCSVNSDKTMCLKIREAIGVIFVDDASNTLLHLVYTVVAATMFGNGVLYRTNSGLILEVCKELSSIGIPVIPVKEEYNCDPKFDTVKVIWLIGHAYHAPASALNRPNICWDEANTQIEKNVWNKSELKMRFTNVKNIWSTFGETFAN